MYAAYLINFLTFESHLKFMFFNLPFRFAFLNLHLHLFLFIHHSITKVFIIIFILHLILRYKFLDGLQLRHHVSSLFV